MKPRVLGLLSAALLFWFGLSGCQSCNCGKEAADEQAGAGPQGEGTQQPQPGQKDLRVTLENYSGPAEGGIRSRPHKRATQAVDLSGMPLVEPVEMDKKPKAPPATIRITSALKRAQEEEKLRRGSKPKEADDDDDDEPGLSYRDGKLVRGRPPAVPLADDDEPSLSNRGNGKLVRGRPQGAKNSPPDKNPPRGRKAGTQR